MAAGAEATGYFVFAEAVTNAQKHANAGAISVRCEVLDGKLYVEVADDGIGGAVEMGGSGLQGLRDRVEAVGRSSPSTATGAVARALRAVIPLAARASAAPPEEAFVARRGVPASGHMEVRALARASAPPGCSASGARLELSMRPAIQATRPRPAANAADARTELRDVSASSSTGRSAARRPPFRPGLVARQRLVARLAGRTAPLALVVAPAGYGKTTALAEWAEHDDRARSRGSRSTAATTTPYACSRDRARARRDRAGRARDLRGPVAPPGRERRRPVPRLGAAHRGPAAPFVLVLDDVHLLARGRRATSRRSSDHVPPGSQLALARARSRSRCRSGGCARTAASSSCGRATSR